MTPSLILLGLAIIAGYLIVCGSLLWLFTFLLAPAEQKPTFRRALFACMLMGIANYAQRKLLNPFIGEWSFLVLFCIGVLIIKSYLRLPFWRSVFALVMYAAIGTTVISFVDKKLAATNQSLTARARAE
jgi:hypothetical protein